MLYLKHNLIYSILTYFGNNLIGPFIGLDDNCNLCNHLCVHVHVSLVCVYVSDTLPYKHDIS